MSTESDEAAGRLFVKAFLSAGQLLRGFAHDVRYFKENVEPRIKAAVEADAEIQRMQADIEAKFCKWEAEYGMPYPRDFADWRRLAVLAGVSGETALNGKWSYADMEPIIEGYLMRRKLASGIATEREPDERHFLPSPNKQLITQEATMPEPATTRDQVFISYSHLDKDWLDKLLTTLKPLIRKQTIDVWADTRIKTGRKWKQEITQALARAKVAVLLVSQNFLASDFIGDEEIPPILAAADSHGLTVVWIPVTASLYDETNVADYQAAHDPAHPLDALNPAELNKALVAIAKIIRDAANP